MTFSDPEFRYTREKFWYKVHKSPTLRDECVGVLVKVPDCEPLLVPRSMYRGPDVPLSTNVLHPTFLEPPSSDPVRAPHELRSRPHPTASYRLFHDPEVVYSYASPVLGS